MTTTQTRKRSIGKVVLIIVLVIVLLAGVLFSLYACFFNPYRGVVGEFSPTRALTDTLTKKQAERDLAYIINHMESRHPAWLDGSDDLVARVNAQYQKELAGLGETVTVLELWQAAGRIVATLGDGHTNVWTNPAREDNYISDVTAMKEYGDPVMINGVRTDDLYEVFLSQFPYETKEYAKSQFYDSLIAVRQYLSFFGVDTSDGVTFTFDTGEGLVDYHYTFVPVEQIKGLNQPQSEEWVYYTIDTDKDVAVFTLLECVYNDEYRSVVADFFEKVHQNGISNIVVDLRGNGGGNSLVADEFISYLDVDTYKGWDSEVRFGPILYKNKDIICQNEKKDPTFSGNVYVLTNVYSFSSAMDFAMLIGDNDLGLIVGEASGNLPSSYGDCLYFQTPNARLCMSASFKKWYRVDLSKNGQPLTPDIECPPGEALDKVYELIQAA